MSHKIGVFSIENNVGCSAMATHIANYLAGGEKSVAYIEPDCSMDKQLNNATVEKEDDGTFFANNIHYYPKEQEEYKEDLLVYDFGCVNILHKFSNDFDKLYLATNSKLSNIPVILDFFAENGSKYDIILIGAPKEHLFKFKEAGLNCISIPDRKESYINYNLATRLNLVLRDLGINPPKYNKGWEFDSIFAETENGEKSSKQGLFGFLDFMKKSPTKKTEAPQEQEDYDDSVEEFVEDIVNVEESGVSVASKKITRDANVYEMPEFVDVPQPIIKTSGEEVTKSTSKEEMPDKVSEKQQELLQKKLEQERNKLLKENEKDRKTAEKLLEQKQKEIDQYHYQATHDELTGAKNRKGYDEDIAQMKVYALITFDVNNLKHTNDTFGHQKGDELLTTVSKAISDTFGKDSIYRMGGDEFVSLLKGQTVKNNDQIRNNLEKIDKILAKKSKKDKEITYEVAYGVAYSTEGNREKVTKLADERMYEDKKNKKQNNEPEQPKEEPVNVAEEKPVAKKPESEESVPKKLRRKKKVVHTGHISVFVTELRHSCGASYVANSIASAMTDIYNNDVYMDHTVGDPMPDNYMVKEIESEEDRFNAYKSGLIVFDKGVFTELGTSAKEDLLRSDVNIMVCSADEDGLKRLSMFIQSHEDTADKWVYAFNHVLDSQKRTLNKAMSGFNYIIIPTHDNAEVPAALRKDYKSMIEFCSAEFR